jgi:hypothetical protein
MAEGGRPRVLDDVKRREICALITAGYDLAGVAQYVGCSRRTIQREILRNEEFSERIRRASLACELEPLNSIRQMARTNWRAAAWYLERTNPNRYGKRNPVLLTPEDVREFLDALSGIVLEEVRSKVTRKRIIRHLLQMAGEIDQAASQHATSSRSSRPMSLKENISSD